VQPDNTQIQWTTKEQYNDRYTGHWPEDCYIWYSEEEIGCGVHRPVSVSNVTVYPSVASVPIIMLFAVALQLPLHCKGLKETTRFVLIKHKQKWEW